MGETMADGESGERLDTKLMQPIFGTNPQIVFAIFQKTKNLAVRFTFRRQFNGKFSADQAAKAAVGADPQIPATVFVDGGDGVVRQAIGFGEM